MAKRTSSTRKRAVRRPSKARRPKAKKAKKPLKKAARRPAPKARVLKKPARATKARKASKARKVKTKPSKSVGAVSVPRPKPGKKAPKVAPATLKNHAHDPHPPTLTRQRRTLPESERTVDVPDADSRLVAEARSGHDAVAKTLREHTESSPKLTAGDVDAKWDDAYAIGDEAPGGDNPTPDQNDVEAIGRALGAEYDDDEELMGGEEIGERDAHRWELDPDSKDEEE
jgi:hypothetical protein